jgi:hypothetical protein
VEVPERGCCDPVWSTSLHGAAAFFVVMEGSCATAATVVVIEKEGGFYRPMRLGKRRRKGGKEGCRIRAVVTR